MLDEAFWISLQRKEAQAERKRREFEEHLSGKVIASVDQQDEVLRILFADGEVLVIRGHTYGDSPLSVELNDARHDT